MRHIVVLIIVIFLITLSTADTLAAYDPISVPNNHVGIHILEPDEIKAASELVNSNGGDWGYITVPIRGNDRDKHKWTEFFQQAKKFHIIPILRLATFGRGDTWVLPTEAEMLHFANFLDQLPWPVQNRYLIIFNETNHSLEWGGFVDPETYADVLNFTIDIFKQKNSDYFILPAALDMATETNHVSYEAMAYWQQVFTAKPDLINKIDGWNSHAYPNPAFSGKPTDTHKRSISSYRHELKLLKTLGRSDIPIFITETGWDQTQFTDTQLFNFWIQAYQNIWTDPQIIAITPFLFQAYDGPFVKFSLLNSENKPTSGYQALLQLNKVAGKPHINQSPTHAPGISNSVTINKQDVQFDSNSQNLQAFLGRIIKFIKQVIHINLDLQKTETRLAVVPTGNRNKTLIINGTGITVEIADTPETITLGLGHRESMPPEQGMLFVFSEPHVFNFWMKNTLFPLDIIWITNNQVVDITRNIPVEPDPANPQNFYSPSQPVNLVLEVNADFAQKHGVKIGDIVETY